MFLSFKRRSSSVKSMIDVGRIIGLVGLILLIVQGGAAGIAYAQCAGGSTSVECTGVDPDGYFTMPGSSTTVTVHSGAQVNGPIFLDGDDTLNVQPGGTISDGLIGGPAVFSANGSQINNAGTITAEGDSANFGIAGINSGPITNSGTIQANGVDTGMGIQAGGDDVRVANSGTIQGTGGLLATGIYGGGTYTVSITNSGTITTDGMANGHGLVAQAGTFAQAANSGTIHASGTMYGVGLVAAGDAVQVTNSGTIDARGGLMAEGLVALAGMGPLQVTNSGTITSSASASGSEALGLLVQGPSSSQINNSGTISASGASQGFGLAVSNNSTITNSGTISGTTASIWGMSLNQTVINSGTLNGDVWLMAGGDSFNAAGGVVHGLIDGGDGYDVLSFTMDISADSWESALAALTGNLDPSGGTVVLGGITYTWANFEELRGLIQLYAIRDRRINGLDIAATAIVYRLQETGVELYTPQGEWAFRAEADAIRAALAQAKSSGGPVEIGARLGLALVAQPDGSLRATGPGYAFAFQPSQSGIDA
jgi:hypothetical protein